MHVFEVAKGMPRRGTLTFVTTWETARGRKFQRTVAFPNGGRSSVTIPASSPPAQPLSVTLAGSASAQLELRRDSEDGKRWTIASLAERSKGAHARKGNISIVADNGELASAIANGEVYVEMIPLGRTPFARPLDGLAYHHRVKSEPDTSITGEYRFDLGSWPTGPYRLQVLAPQHGTQTHSFIHNADTASVVSLDLSAPQLLSGARHLGLDRSLAICGARLEWTLASMFLGDLQSGVPSLIDPEASLWQDPEQVRRSGEVYTSDGWVTIFMNDSFIFARVSRLEGPAAANGAATLSGRVALPEGLDSDRISVNLCTALFTGPDRPAIPVTVEMCKMAVASDGRFRFDQVPPGHYSLIVSTLTERDGEFEYRFSETASRHVFLPPDQAVELEILSAHDLH